MIKEIRISGSGGQGIILAGIVLTEAVGIYEGKQVLQVEDYGGAVRGGAVRSEILVGPDGEEIMYPAVIKADILLALSQEAANSWTGAVKEDACIVYDSTCVTKVPATKVKTHSVPITQTTIDRFKTETGVNMLALGVLCELTGIVGKEGLEWAVKQNAPKGTVDFNLRALREGFDLGREFVRRGAS